MSDLTVYPLLMVLLLTAIAAVWDLRTGEIPNRLLVLGAGACSLALLLGSAAPGSASALRTVLSMLAGLLLVSLVPGLLYRAGGMGGGDLKLLAVVGAALGPYLGLEAELYAFVVAVLYAPARLIWEGRLRHSLGTLWLVISRPLTPESRRPAPVPVEELTSLRFAPAIFVGTLLAAIPHLGGLR